VLPQTHAVAPPAPRKPRASGVWVVLAVSLVVTIGLAAVAALLLHPSLWTLPWNEMRKGKLAAEAPAPPAEAPETAAEKPAETAAPPLALAERAQAPTADTPKPAPSSPPPPMAAETVPRGSVEIVELPPAEIPESASALSAWPRLKLVGVMAKADVQKGSAVMDNTLVEVGEGIQGVQLLEVRPTGVLLQYHGQTQFVRVGQVTQ